MISRLLSFLSAATIGLAVSLSPASAQEKIKVGYWTSGFSVGFGAVLEVGKFLEAQGLTPEFIKFSDVNGPTKALLTHSIDGAFAAPATGALKAAASPAPAPAASKTREFRQPR